MRDVRCVMKAHVCLWLSVLVHCLKHAGKTVATFCSVIVISAVRPIFYLSGRRGKDACESCARYVGDLLEGSDLMKLAQSFLCY